MRWLQFFAGWLLSALALFCVAGASPQDAKVYKIAGAGNDGEKSFTLDALESAFGARTIASAYFDRAMHYRDSRLRVIPLGRIVERFGGVESDALLLDCFDDYQGIVPLADIALYDLQLTTRIEVRPEFKKPDWLNPLLIAVPDTAADAPYQERFMTANIRAMRFVRLADYYAPLQRAAGTSDRDGFKVFTDNCLFCHSLHGIGGNKGAKLLERYEFGATPGRDRLKADFWTFHGKDNPGKQDVSQFVTQRQLEDVISFLQGVKAGMR